MRFVGPGDASGRAPGCGSAARPLIEPVDIEQPERGASPATVRPLIESVCTAAREGLGTNYGAALGPYRYGLVATETDRTTPVAGTRA